METYKEIYANFLRTTNDKKKYILGNLPNTFRLKKENIIVNPVGTYFTLLLPNVTYYTPHHYMTTCHKKEEYKTVRYFCDIAVSSTQMDFPIP